MKSFSVFLQKKEAFLCWIGLLFLVGVNSSQAAYQSLDKVVAVVDDGVVLESELKSRIVTITSRLNAQGTPLPPQDVMRKRILEQLVTEQVQLQMAEREGLRIDDNQLTETMANIASRNGMSLEEFQVAIRSEGVTFAEAREQIRREMLTSRLQQKRVNGRVRVTDKEVENFLASSAGRSALDYYLGHILLALPENPSSEQVAQKGKEALEVLAEIRSGVDFRQMAVARSDGRNALEGGVLGWRKETELPTIAADIVPKMAVGEVSEPIRTDSGFHLIALLDKRGGASQVVTQKNVRHILVKPSEIKTPEEARAEIDVYYKKLLAGEDFSALAKEHSEDPISAVSGGELGWVGPGDMVETFEQQMNNTPTGVYSEPFLSPFGWHVLQVTEVREQDIGAKLQANQAREVLTRKKYDTELVKWLREIRAEAFVELKDQ
ncbi:MAG: peptidylprolyl isomerase [Hahellaceae bacterium]|nr:peptidylprolyl isomerase [Hahellaceae bacterium]